jgi:uncharacterized phage protein (TIGR02218 family)
MKQCSAVLGDRHCRFDLGTPGSVASVAPVEVERCQAFVFPPMGSFAPRWFERGRLFVLSGDGAGLEGVIKHDRPDTRGQRVIELWEPIRALVAPGDAIRLEAGCDKRIETCRGKFANQVNFRGFPFVPGEDWLVAIPAAQASAGGG